MNTFEIMPLDFNGSSEGQSLLVWCRSGGWLRDSLKGAPSQSCILLRSNISPDEYDFIMPKDVQALHERLRALAGLPQLSEMERGKTYYHPQYGDVVFIASDPDDGAYLICKYWDTTEDAQAYFGCEANDLRFIKTVTPTGAT